MSNIVYFELNDWFSGRDYPNAEPFRTWMDDDVLQFCDKKWVKENKLCVVVESIDMSINVCVTATEEWVKQNCPKLLSDEETEVSFTISGPAGEHEQTERYPYASFLRHPDEDGKVYGNFGTEFLPYEEANFGVFPRKPAIFTPDEIEGEK